MKKIFKCKNLFLVTFLAIAGFFSVAAVVTNKQVNETPVVEKADADDMTSSDWFYFRPSSGWIESNARFAVYFFGSGDEWQSMTSVTLHGSSDKIYRAKASKSGYTTVIFCRMNPGTSVNNWDNRWTQTNDVPISGSHYNLYETTGAYNSKAGNWVSCGISEFYFKTPSNGSVTVTPYEGSTAKSNISTNSTVYMYGDWKVKYTATPNTGYTLKTWTYSGSPSGSYVPWSPEEKTNPVTINLDNKNTYHSANFLINTYTVTVQRNDNSGGTVSPTSVSVNHGSTTTLTATASTGYTFRGWKKDSGSSFVSTSASYTTAAITANTTYTAYFSNNSGYNIYVDASKWNLDTTPKIHYWDSHSDSYEDVSGRSITSVTGGTYSNSKYWAFTVYPINPTFSYIVYTGNLGSPTKQTVDVSYDGSNNAIYVESDTKPSAVWEFNSDGTINTITKYKVLGENSPVYLGIDYVLDGIEYKPLHDVQVGYNWSEWNDEPDGSGTTYSEDTGTAISDDITIYAIFTTDEDTIVVLWKKSLGKRNIYIWKDGGSYYKAWPGDPGVEVTINGVDYYAYDVPNNFDRIKFSNNGASETDAITFSSSNEGQCWDNGWSDIMIPLQTMDGGATPSAYSGDESRDTSFKFNKDYSIPDGSKNGHIVEGWYLTSDCSGSPITKLDKFMFISTVTIYAKWLSGETAAKAFATDFTTTIGGICVYQGGTPFETLKNAWNNTGTSSQEYKYSQLPEYVRYWLKNNPSSDTDISAYVAMYNYILGKYHYGTGSDKLHDFMGTKPPTSSAIRSFSPFNLISGDDGDNAATIIIIIASSISLLSITALSVLMVKKRKSKQQ